jgi:putative phage-type endonuclease
MFQTQRVKELLSSEYAEQRTQEWLDLRDNMITASDVASAIGENRYESEDAFVRKKVLKTKWGGNAATEHGTKLEPYVRDLYDSKYNKKTYEIGVVQHRVYKFLGGSPDGITEDGLLIEIKCPLTRKIDTKIPAYYIPQIQLLLEILDLEECDFIEYKPPSLSTEEQFVVKRVSRDRDWFAKYLPIMERVWKRIVIGRQFGLCEIEGDEEIYCDVINEEVCA